jgi:hypothetical protein
MIDLGTIIEEGTRLQKKHYSKHYDVEITYRPLSDYEYNKVLAESIKEVSKDDSELSKRLERKLGKPDEIKKEGTVTFTLLSIEIMARVVYAAIKDFAKDTLTIDHIRKMRGLNDLYTKVMNVTNKSESDVKFFRKDTKGQDTKVSNF